MIPISMRKLPLGFEVEGVVGVQGARSCWMCTKGWHPQEVGWGGWGGWGEAGVRVGRGREG